MPRRWRAAAAGGAPAPSRAPSPIARLGRARRRRCPKRRRWRVQPVQCSLCLRLRVAMARSLSWSSESAGKLARAAAKRPNARRAQSCLLSRFTQYQALRQPSDTPMKSKRERPGDAVVQARIQPQPEGDAQHGRDRDRPTDEAEHAEPEPDAVVAPAPRLAAFARPCGRSPRGYSAGSRGGGFGPGAGISGAPRRSMKRRTTPASRRARAAARRCAPARSNSRNSARTRSGAGWRDRRPAPPRGRNQHLRRRI